MSNELTPKQEKFAQGLFKGLSQREAYKRSFNAQKMKESTIDRNAHELFKNSKILARLKELQERVASKEIITKEEILQKLKKVAEVAEQYMVTTKYFGSNANKGVTAADAGTMSALTGALNEINKMCGFHAPKEQNIKIGGDSVDIFREYVEALKSGK